MVLREESKKLSLVKVQEPGSGCSVAVVAATAAMTVTKEGLSSSSGFSSDRSRMSNFSAVNHRGSIFGVSL